MKSLFFLNPDFKISPGCWIEAIILLEIAWCPCITNIFSPLKAIEWEPAITTASIFNQLPSIFWKTFLALSVAWMSVSGIWKALWSWLFGLSKFLCEVKLLDSESLCIIFVKRFWKPVISPAGQYWWMKDRYLLYKHIVPTAALSNHITHVKTSADRLCHRSAIRAFGKLCRALHSFKMNCNQIAEFGAMNKEIQISL